ncbi:bis(5'-nucleosyl)-tetraphosphatase (symmetrical) YqeK [Alteribacter natronophilus]|uniref:bis(5'-nucleosyl)-tetraphosphatase (symmetrical) YqeK n=1 Tax=Alteribacter natronophilus TaxID=2583810 RepID=UPI00110F207C|nr:bis(5'-nucleosyl)-tetraphosphatase (symmetrical) YqeK [Alteribacter natronophilus]TMW73884.1 HD domain-containing protein [Alteribacter natronophilus]
MNEQDALKAVEKELRPSRYAHTLRVRDSAVTLAEKYGVSREDARLAAVLHDYAKYRPADRMKQVILEADWLDDEWTKYGEPILHAPAGAVYVKNELGCTDPDILDAIVYHTTGKAGMTLLEKVIFLADYIEPGRTTPGVDSVREEAEHSLDRACFLALSGTIQFLVRRRQLIFPDTIHAYNDLAGKIMRKN